MADFSNPPKSPTLLPPRKSVELEDPGAHELGPSLYRPYAINASNLTKLTLKVEASASENEDDVFADASEGQGSHSRPSSPIPTTRVEKVSTRNILLPGIIAHINFQVDDRESHGEVPGTAAYKMRTQDAVPDELEIIPEGGRSRSNSMSSQKDNLTSPGGMPIPKTVVEKVDPTSPSHGDVPGTAAHAKRKADAVPDAILPVSGQQKNSSSPSEGEKMSPEIPIPRTVVTRVDSMPAHGEVPGTDAFNIRQGDATPDIVEKKGDVSGKPKFALLGAVQRANDPISITNQFIE